MQIGRFFSLGQGRVGQFLSPRVLVVRSPFQSRRSSRSSSEFCCFGFDTFNQAQRFIQLLFHQGLRFKWRQSQVLLDFPYEVIVWDQIELARTLAFWERRDLHQLQQVPELPRVRSNFANPRPDSPPAIAA